MQLLNTPLTPWHRSHGAKMSEFAGYEMPIQYGSIVAEHIATRTAIGLFDVSHMGRLRFDGPRADQLLDHLLTRRVTDMTIGQVRYSLVCNESGGVLDDVLVSCLESPSGKQYFLLVVNASNRQKLLKWITPHLADFPDVTLNDVTEQTAMFAIQGPKAIEICQPLFSFDLNRLRYFRSQVTQQMSKPVIVSRTGYTGEDGIEIIVRNDDAHRVWENLMLSGRSNGIQPAGLAARDTLRLEAGMPLYGHELDESINPYEAGLGFAVNLDDRSFIGSDCLKQVQEAGPKRVRVGLQLEGKRAARQGAPIFAVNEKGNGPSSEQPVGIITSGSPSPTLNYPIAMGLIQPDLAQLGQPLSIDLRGTHVPATVCKIPFYQRAKDTP